MQHHAPARRFEIGEALAEGWRKFWPNIIPMALFALAVWLVNGLVQWLQGEQTNWFLRFIVSVLAFLVAQLISIGWIKLALDIVDGRPVSAEAVTERFQLVVPYLIAAVIFSIMVSIGLVLLIVPGIIVILVFGFYGFHIVDTGDTSPMNAFRRSAEITSGHRGQLFLLGLVLIGINLVGLLVLIVGVLISSGISLLAIAYVYRRLSGGTGATSTDRVAPA